jgi:putative DNA primase/helicase
VAGSGKSYYFDILAVIVSGQRMPVISAGRSQDETEKRIGAAVVAGQPLICIDNLNGDNGELGGSALSQITERPRPQVRILGKSELVEVEACGVTLFANGINIVIAGDITRRVIKCRLDPRMERPELREYRGDPVATVLKDRGAYVAAALTIARAYIAADRPNRQPPLASFKEWSDTVRSALMWLGMKDPVASQDDVKEDDPERIALRALLAAFSDKYGIGPVNHKALRDVVDDAFEMTQANSVGERNFVNPELQSAVMAVLPQKTQKSEAARVLGVWMRGRKDRIVDGKKFTNESDQHHGSRWWVADAADATKSTAPIGGEEY